MSSYSVLNTLPTYSNLFFDAHEHGMLQSARLVLPIVMRLIKPSSVVDVGCGRGAWLRVCQELGVSTVQGLDGAYVDQTKLLIPGESFTCADLSNSFELSGRYDLAICLEVGEHLPDAMAAALVSKLTRAAPAILFSAALPGQNGTGHINERMPAYWRALFRQHDYVLLDPIRPEILTERRVEPWYRQNIVLYASETLIRSRPELETFRMPEAGLGIDWVQAYIYQGDVRSLSKRLTSALCSAIRRRTARLLRLI